MIICRYGSYVNNVNSQMSIEFPVNFFPSLYLKKLDYDILALLNKKNCLTSWHLDRSGLRCHKVCIMTKLEYLKCLPLLDTNNSEHSQSFPCFLDSCSINQLF